MKERTILAIIAIVAIMSATATIAHAVHRTESLTRLVSQAEVERVDTIEEVGGQFVVSFCCDNGMKGQFVFDSLNEALKFTGEVSE